MPAAQHQRGAGFADPGDELSQGEPGLDVAADGVEDDEQALDLGVLLNIDELGDDMLILGGFLVFGGQAVPLDGADDRQTVDSVPPLGGRQDAVLGHKVVFEAFEGRALVGVEGGAGLGFAFGVIGHSAALLFCWHISPSMPRPRRRYAPACAARKNLDKNLTT